MKKLLVVPLCFVVGALLMVFLIVILVDDLRRHPSGYRNTSDADQIFLIIVWLTHRLLILLVAVVAALGWMGLWLVGLLYAFGRLPPS